MSEIVVDASVALCWFAAESETLAAKRLIRSAVNLTAPSLLLVELASGLWKKTRRGELDGELAREAMREVWQFVPQFVDMAELAGPALALARELDHSVYDCVYLALARRRGAPFATLDRRFVDRIATTRFAGDVVHLADWS